MELLHAYMFLFMAVTVSSEIKETYKLIWTPQLPLRFKQDVILKCIVKNCCSNLTKWTGGPHGTVLTYNRHSLNDLKYEELWGRNENNLVIKNFGLNDANHVYTCYHGFDNYEQNLALDQYSYELLPTEDTVRKEIQLREGQLEVNIKFLEVYPKPECLIFFGKENISNQLLQHEQKVQSFFYKVRYYLKYEVCAEECNDFLTMMCMIGSRNITVLESYQVFQTLSCRDLVFFLYFLLIWIAFLCIGLCFLVLCTLSFGQEKIEWFRYNVPVFTAISLIFVLLGVVAFVMGDSCKITSVKMNDFFNRQYAAIAVSLAAIFALFSVVVLIVFYSRSRSRSQITNEAEEPPWIIACLIYWCYPCKKRALISTEKMEAKGFELTGEYELDIEV